VQLSASTPTANLISGGIDEIFNRADSTGAYTPLQDALGSTIALVDASGNAVTSYAYDPFGNTTASGAASSNAFQYTGRENEGNGLYFYRARYYSPLLGRFVNEDPLGFYGGNFNLYGYVGDDPINFSDPGGLCRDPGGPGPRYCIETFIPTAHEKGFGGDNRGFDPNGGSFRTHQDVTIGPDGATDIGHQMGTSSLGPFHHEASESYCWGRITRFPKLAGRYIHLECAASDGIFFGAAPDAAYAITINETEGPPKAYGKATPFPSLEVWEYQDGKAPVCILCVATTTHAGPSTLGQDNMVPVGKR